MRSPTAAEVAPICRLGHRLPVPGHRDTVSPVFGTSIVKYISTRGDARLAGFEEVLLAGLAPDGGLYVPQSWPTISAQDLRRWRGLSYADLAARVLAPFVGDALTSDELAALVKQAYRDFDHAAVAPLRQLDHDLWLLELFHGPTLAFKDYALQLVGRLFDHMLTRRGARATIVGATSGDTGSAAIEGCRHSASIDIVILHPKGRISDIPRRQMTTVDAPNVTNIAVDSTFDDCQDLVKSMFADSGFRDEMHLGVVNSMNWARVMAQIVYYVAAALALGAPERRMAFAVPTGNFGNVYAAHAAKQMGVPIDHLTVGGNRNDIFARFLDTGVLAIGAVEATQSPSMDIQVPSNVERLLFDLYERDGAAVAEDMKTMRATGRLAVGEERWRRARELFDGQSIDDTATLATIRDLHAETGVLIDPHSAVGVAAARRRVHDRKIPTVVVATAHPAKFPDAVERATGRRPALPPRLSDLFEREERFTPLPNDLAALQQFMRSRVSRAAA